VKLRFDSDTQSLALLYWILLSNAIGVSSMMSVLPAVGRESDIPDVLIVSIQALSAVLGFIMTPIWAAQSDRHGRKPIVLLGCAGFAASCFVTGFAILIGVNHWAPPLATLAGLIAGRAIFGALGLASVPASQAYVAEHTRPEARARTLAALGSSQGVGNIIGPAVTPWMIFAPLSLAGPLLIIGASSVVTLVVAAWKLPATPEPAPSPTDAQRPRGIPFARLWRDPRFRPLISSAALVGICAIANLQMIGFLVIDVLKEEPIAAQSYTARTLMIGAATALIGQLGFVRWFRMGPPQLLLWGAVLAAMGNLILAFAPAYAAISAAFGLTSLGYAFAAPGYISAASLLASREEQGEVVGVVLSAGMFGLIFAPIAAMMLYHFWRPSPFLMCTLLMLVLCRLTLRAQIGNLSVAEGRDVTHLRRANDGTERDA
jgi:MFS family permease